MRRFAPPARVVFGARDRALNPRVAATFADLFPRCELHLLPDAGHYVKVDDPVYAADHVLTPWPPTA
jgi:pimeloyl-ACP methyl ester carboxylesterase